MDYSAIHEQSPWATSPQHSRTPSAQVEPPSPTPALPPSVQEDPSENGTPRISQDTTVVENGHVEEPSTPRSPEQVQLSPDQPQAPQLQSPPQHQAQQQHPQPQHKPPRSQQRYHGQRPRSRQEVPNYKLQPKVTGLDRPTRKELNIRFDVYARIFGFDITREFC